jgi:hypothetical protein
MKGYSFMTIGALTVASMVCEAGWTAYRILYRLIRLKPRRAALWPRNGLGRAGARQTGALFRKKLRMNPRYRTGIRRRGPGTILSIFGILLWVIAAVPHLAAADSWYVSLQHIEERSLGVIAGAVFVEGGIVLLVTPARHRKRYTPRRTVGWS